MKRKVLWFIAGPFSEADKNLAAEKAVLIRDSRLFSETDAVELCTGVCGDEAPCEFYGARKGVEVLEAPARKNETKAKAPAKAPAKTKAKAPAKAEGGDSGSDGEGDAS